MSARNAKTVLPKLLLYIKNCAIRNHGIVICMIMFGSCLLLTSGSEAVMIYLIENPDISCVTVSKKHGVSALILVFIFDFRW